MQNPNQIRRVKPLTQGEIGPVELRGRFADLTSTDPAEFEIALRPWELMCKPTDAGSFRHRLLILQAPSFLIYEESYELPVHLQGITPPNMLGVGFPDELGSAAQFWGSLYDSRSLPASAPGALDAKLPAGHTHLVAFVDMSCLRRALSPQLCEALFKSATSNKIVLDQNIAIRAKHWLRRLLREAATSPDLASSPAKMNLVFRRLIDLFGDVGLYLAPPTDISSFTARQNGLKRLLEYSRSNPTANLSMSDVCRITGVGERSVQLAFQETFKTTPKKFLTRRRLHAARHELLSLGASDSRVSDVANKYGFLEFGRFASQYRNEFGELPSQTLARNFS